MVGTQSPIGRTAFAMLLFEDLALVPIVFALGVLGPHGRSDDFSGLVQTLWVGGVTVIALLFLGRALLPRLFRQAARAKNRSEEHTSELQSLMRISYAVFCLKKKKKT